MINKIMLINSCIIIDNFYEDPYSVRATAMSMDYYEPKYSEKFKDGTGPWPGRVSKGAYALKNMDVVVSKLLGFPVRSTSQEYGGTGYFRLSQKDDTPTYYTHVDSIPNGNLRVYSGIVYLNPPEDCYREDGSQRAGTRFFTHKESGRNKVNNNKEYMSTELDFNDPTKWTEDAVVGFRWNRLVLVENSIYHTYGDLFGDSKETARCTQLFAFYTI